MMDSLRIATSQEKPLEASKWIHCQSLLSANEMQALFDSLEPFALFLAGSITENGHGELSKSHFLEIYHAYITDLLNGKEPAISDYRHYFSAVMTATPDAVYKVLIGENRQLVRVSKPVIQLQAHHMDYSKDDGKFRSMMLGSNTISWGIQFSFPQLFQDGISKEVLHTRHQNENINTQLFQRLQKWMRQHTIPSPFYVEDTLINVPARLGKDCFSWINNHPQLLKKGIQVKIKTS